MSPVSQGAAVHEHYVNKRKDLYPLFGIEKIAICMPDFRGKLRQGEKFRATYIYIEILAGYKTEKIPDVLAGKIETGASG